MNFRIGESGTGWITRDKIGANSQAQRLHHRRSDLSSGGNGEGEEGGEGTPISCVCQAVVAGVPTDTVVP